MIPCGVTLIVAVHAALGGEPCGRSNPNSCTAPAPGGVPGCSDASCCVQVCGFDAFCCTETWDAQCAALAALLCVPPPNDECDGALTVQDGVTPFASFGATGSGQSHAYCQGSGIAPIENDVWFHYVASCTGLIIVNTCGSFFDTNLAVYDGASCGENLRGCNDNFCGDGAIAFATVSRGAVYTVRIGSPDGSTGNGSLTIACNPTCRNAEIISAQPPDGTIDARDPQAASMDWLGGPMRPIRIQMPEDAFAASACFRLCETATDGQTANAIAEARHLGGGLYSITLRRPITPNAVTTIEYAAGSGSVGYFAHAGNVNGDGATDAQDVLALLDIINSVPAPRVNLLSADIDRSGVVNLGDVTRLIDRLNGVGVDHTWYGLPLPNAQGCR